MVLKIPFYRFFQFVVCCLILATPVSRGHADTLYVKPVTEVTIRSGQGTDYRILAMIGDGDQVELLEENNGWAHVRLNNGREGWILRRYLSDQPSLKNQIARLEKENERLKTEKMQLEAKVTSLTESTAAAEKKLEKNRAALKTIKNKYQQLQENTRDTVQAHKAAAEAKKQLQTMEKKVAALTAENTTLHNRDSLRWFLAGGGVLLLGWLLGRLNLKSRRRSSLL